MVTALNESDSGGLRAQVAEEVRVLLARRRISGVQLARRLGMSQGYLSRRLNGVQPFDMDDLEKIANGLDVPVSILFGDLGSSGQATRPKLSLLDGDFDYSPELSALAVVAA